MKLERFKERNNKRIGIIVFTITCILLVSGVIFYRTFAIFEVKTNQNVIKGTVQDPGDIYFAYYVDEKIQKEMPQKDSGYILDEEQSYCGELGSKNETIIPTLNKEDWSITIKGMKTSRTKCNLYFRDYYKVKVNEKEYHVQTNLSELKVENETNGNILLCNNGVTAREEENEIHLNNITKDSACRFYETSNNAIDNIDDSKDYILFLNDETETSTWTIPGSKEVTIDLNGHTKTGNINNSGILYLKSSKVNNGTIQNEQGILLSLKGNSHTEIENLKLLTNQYNPNIMTEGKSYIKLVKVNLENESSDAPSGIYTSENGTLEVIDSNIKAPYGIGGSGGNILVEDSNITATKQVGIRTNENYEGNVVISGNTTITAQTSGIYVSQGTLELNGTVDNYPRITGQTESGIRIGYGIFNYQYGEIYGKQENNIQGATLTRQGTTITTKNQEGMYRTYLKQITTE